MLDPAGIPISTAAGDQTVPAVAFDGTNYLVVWQDTYGLGTPALSTARFVSPGGVSLTDPSRFRYRFPPADAAPAVAFDGTNYLVALGTGPVALTAFGWHVRGPKASSGSPALPYRPQRVLS